MEELFNKVIEYGHLVRSKNGHGIDGLTAWGNLKPLLSSVVINCDWKIIRNLDGTISSDLNQIYDYVHDVLGMKGDDHDDQSNHELWEKYHFFLQLIRIPKNTPELSLLKLCQIAYNIGQLSHYIDSENPEDKKIFNSKVKNYYNSNNLDKLSSYIDVTTCVLDEESASRLVNQIDLLIKMINEQSGGYSDIKYKNKYLKYKNKYLQLKKYKN